MILQPLHRRRNAHACIVPALLMLGLLGGCDSVRLYSKTRDDQGKAAKEAWAAVDLVSVITTERGNLQKLLDLELDTQDQLAAGIRDHELRYLVSAATLREGLVDPVDARLAHLVGPRDQFDATVEVRAQIRKTQRELVILREEFAFKKIKLPECAAVASDDKLKATLDSFSIADPNDRAETKGLLLQRRKYCSGPDLDEMKDVFEPLSGETGGAMGAAVDQYKADVAALETIRGLSNAQQEKYEAALAQYKLAVKAATADPSKAAEVQKRAQHLSDEIAGLVSLGDAFSVSFLSEQRLDAIESFLGAVAEAKPGEPPRADSGDAAAALIVVPNLLDQARASIADSRRPLAMPLLLRRNHELLKLEGARREIAIREAMVRVSRELMETIYAEGSELSLAAGELADVKPWHGHSVQDAFSKGKTAEKELLYGAAARYLDAIRRLDAKRYKLEYQRIAASHELSLAYSEVNAKQWQALIGVSVDQLAEFSAGGIKSEQIVDLINAAAMIWIGNGVNK